MATQPKVYWIQSDNLLEVRDVVNATTSANVNDAVVTLTCYSGETDTEVPGETWPLTMPYVSGSSGVYRGTLKDTLTVDHRDTIRAEVTVSAGSDLKLFLCADIIVRKLKFT